MTVPPCFSQAANFRVRLIQITWSPNNVDSAVLAGLEAKLRAPLSTITGDELADIMFERAGNANSLPFPSALSVEIQKHSESGRLRLGAACRGSSSPWNGARNAIFFRTAPRFTFSLTLTSPFGTERKMKVETFGAVCHHRGTVHLDCVGVSYAGRRRLCRSENR